MRDAHPLMKHRRIRATTRARRVGGGGRWTRERTFPPASMVAKSVYRSPMNGSSMMESGDWRRNGPPLETGMTTDTVGVGRLIGSSFMENPVDGRAGEIRYSRMRLSRFLRGRLPLCAQVGAGKRIGPQVQRGKHRSRKVLPLGHGFSTYAGLPPS